MSMKNIDDTNVNRTRDLPACSAVPQPTAPQGAPRTVHKVWFCCRWPRGLRRGSEAVSLLRLRVRIPPGEDIVRCQVEVSATDRSLVQRCPTECVCH